MPRKESSMIQISMRFPKALLEEIEKRGYDVKIEDHKIILKSRETNSEFVIRAYHTRWYITKQLVGNLVFQITSASSLKAILRKFLAYFS